MMVPEWILELINSRWGATIIGWILGLLTAWMSARRLAGMQSETIRTLSAALAKFEDNFKQSLEPTTDAEKDQIASARDSFIDRDYEPSGQRVFWRTAKVPAAWLIAAVAFFVIAGLANWAGAPNPRTPPQGWLGTVMGFSFAFGWISVFLTFGSVLIFRELYRDVREKIAGERLQEAQDAVRGLKLNEKQYDHLRRWALSHPFDFFARASVLRRIDLASIATRRATPRLVEPRAA